MNINIYGSTGVIGRKALALIDKNFPEIKVNLLCAKSNINLLIQQIKKNYVHIVILAFGDQWIH